ncbi:Ppx/GppA phosphatase family protein [Novosphingobium sp. EMRT-2]|uniref:Ppx/GppA phosphatase family protein n=1 Tax=Novosphingobium sp. EMRT-2 TaxID=2571749 RepID=UPI0010BD70B5|nr:Ppx/GppA phosphatase family protein [Novosphingobium sp. EMRT-2]QCI94195.1 Ppx/GppA family phosphatase [Novosphingobium sp. EMRT-2]
MAEINPPAPGQGARSGSKKRQRPPPHALAGSSSLQPKAAGVPQGAMRPPEAPALPEESAQQARPLWNRPMPFHRQAYAAIDLGTNNCRLLIARPSGDHFVVIDAFSRVVRLGEGLAQSGRLSDAAMDRALGALHVCAEKLRKRNVHLARSVATEACRRATNGAEFIERVHSETGIRLNIITAQEEARLAVLGCHILLEHGDGPAMIFDIGGGSTEMVLVDTGEPVPRILDWQSVPWGVVSLTESIGAISDEPAARAAAFAEMRRRVDEGFAAFAERVAGERAKALKRGAIRLLGTSGTVTTLASLHLKLPQYDRRAVDGLIVPVESMRGISRRLSSLSPTERIAVPCIGRERSDLVVAGCAILESIFDIWPAERLGIADRGIREGILRSLMATGGEAERSREALRAIRRKAGAQMAADQKTGDQTTGDRP